MMHMVFMIIYPIDTLTDSTTTCTGAFGCCSTFSNTDTNFCAGGTVDYSFYVPAGSSVNTLNTIAWSNSIPTYLDIVSNTCHQDFKRMLCSTIYNKCPSSKFLVSFVVCVKPYVLNGYD